MRVIIESPFAGDIKQSLAYVRACMRDCFMRGEHPFASHALYTQPGVLDDDDPAERQLGIEAGLFWGECAAKTVVYTDLGLSQGMRYGIENAQRAGRLIEYRSLPDWGLVRPLSEETMGLLPDLASRYPLLFKGEP